MRIIEAGISPKYLEMLRIPSSISDNIAIKLDEYPKNIQNKINRYLKNLSKTRKITEKDIFDIISSLDIREEIEVSPEYQKIINNLSQDKSEREWLKKLVKTERFKFEDAIKIKNLLNDFHTYKKDERIGDFKDDIALSEYVSKFKKEEKSISQESLSKIDGVDFIDEVNDISLYHITSQKGLDYAGKDATWCVLTKNGGYKYNPLDYYMFYQDNEPVALYHAGSRQFKNFHDAPITDDSKLALDLFPLVTKHNLDKNEDQKDLWTDDDDDMGDYNYFIKDVKDIVEKMRRSPNIQKEIDYYLFNAGKTFLVPDDIFQNNIEYIVERLESLIGTTTAVNEFMRDLSFSKKDFLINYAKIHGKDKVVKFLQDYVNESILAFGFDLNWGSIRKKIPKEMISEDFKNARITKIIERLRFSPQSCESFFQNEEAINKNSEAIKNREDGWIHEMAQDIFYFEKNVPQDIMNSPRILTARINNFIANYKESYTYDRFGNRMSSGSMEIKGLESVYAKAPDVVKNNEQVKEARITAWANIYEMSSNFSDLFYIDEIIPEDIQKSNFIKNVEIKAWEYQISSMRYESASEFASRYKDFPDRIKNNPAIIKTITELCLFYVNKNAFNFQSMPTYYLNLPIVKNAVTDGFIKLFKRSPDLADGYISKIHLTQNERFEEIQQARFEGWRDYAIKHGINNIPNDLVDKIQQYIKNIDDEISISAKSQNRLWASSFNDNFIGNIF